MADSNNNRASCSDCKYNRGGKCVLHPYGKVHSITGYVHTRPCSQVNYDGNCKQYQPEGVSVFGILACLLLVVCIVLAIICQNL